MHTFQKSAKGFHPFALFTSQDNIRECCIVLVAVVCLTLGAEHLLKLVFIGEETQAQEQKAQASGQQQLRQVCANHIASFLTLLYMLHAIVQPKCMCHGQRHSRQRSSFAFAAVRSRLFSMLANLTAGTTPDQRIHLDFCSQACTPSFLFQNGWQQERCNQAALIRMPV